MPDISKIKLLNGTEYTVKDAAVRTRVDAIESTLASALVFKGVASNAAAIISLTGYKRGWSYKASANFTIPNVGAIESGDMIICVGDYDASLGYSALDWTVVQNNVDVFAGASSNAAGSRGLVPAPAQGDQGLFLRGDSTWATPSADISGSLLSATRLAVAASADGSTGYIPVYFDVNGKLCVQAPGWYNMSILS